MLHLTKQLIKGNPLIDPHLLAQFREGLKGEGALRRMQGRPGSLPSGGDAYCANAMQTLHAP
jgi:hypothetical protein